MRPPATFAPKGCPAISMHSRRSMLALLWLSVSLFSTGVHAQACPGEWGESLPTPEKMRDLEPVLMAAEQRCNDNALFLAYRGAWHLQLGEGDKAAVFLERALMLNPELSGAQLDYAQALAASGDTASAESLYRQLLSDRDLPGALRALVSSGYQSLYNPALAKAWTFAVVGAVRAGRDTNLNGAPTTERLTLTLPDGDAILALGESYRPRGGSASVADLRLQAQRDWRGVGQLRLAANLNAREAKAAGYRQHELAAYWTQPGFAQGQAGVAWQTTAMRYEGQSLLNAHRLQAFHDWPLPVERACRARIGGEVELRQYPTSPPLDGTYRGVASYVGCAVGPGLVGMHLRSGIDKAQNPSRPGGDQTRHELRIQGILPVGKTRLEAEAGTIRQIDSSGYSPLLESNATRWQRRDFARLEWSYPASKVIDLFLAADFTRQTSNLALFENKASGFWLGARFKSQW